MPRPSSRSVTPRALAGSHCWCRPHLTIQRLYRMALLGPPSKSGTNPFLTAFSDLDPAFGSAAPPGAYTSGLPIDRFCQERVPGSSGQPHITIVGATHFVQE